MLYCILVLYTCRPTPGKIAPKKKRKQYGSPPISIYKPKINEWFRDGQKFEWYSVQYQSICLSMKKSPKVKKTHGNIAINSNIVHETICNASYRRKIRSNVRNKKYTKKQKNKVYMYIFISLARARIHLAPYSVIALLFVFILFLFD